MLKKDPKGAITSREVGIFHRKRVYRFRTGKIYTLQEWEEEAHHFLLRLQNKSPQMIMRDNSNGKTWWMFKHQFWWEDEGYNAEQIEVLILDRQQKEEEKIRRAMARVSQPRSEPKDARRAIPSDVRDYVWRRDQGRCVECGSRQRLEFDHVIPIAKGGSNTARNIQLLCENCNRKKGANIS